MLEGKSSEATTAGSACHNSRSGCIIYGPHIACQEKLLKMGVIQHLQSCISLPVPIDDSTNCDATEETSELTELDEYGEAEDDGYQELEVSDTDKEEYADHEEKVESAETDLTAQKEPKMDTVSEMRAAAADTIGYLLPRRTKRS